MPETITPNPNVLYPDVQAAPSNTSKAGLKWIYSGGVATGVEILDSTGAVVSQWTTGIGVTQFLKSSAAEQIALVRRTVTITSAAAVTPVSILTDAEVAAFGATAKVFLSGFVSKVNGATVWATTATVKIQDTNGTPVDFVTVDVAAMTANAVILPGTASVTLENAFTLGTGGTAGKGLQIKGDANGTGSNYVVTVFAYVKF